MTCKLTRLTGEELAETLRVATSGYPLSANAEENLRHVFAELQERRKAEMDSDRNKIREVNVGGNTWVQCSSTAYEKAKSEGEIVRELYEHPPIISSEPVIADCDPVVFEKGVSACLVDIPKETAEIICKGISAATGFTVDWHYIGGRVHIKALPPSPQPAPVVPDVLERLLSIVSDPRALPPHIYRELVNDLKNTAQKHAGAGSLREALSQTLSRYIKPQHKS